ncbi:hypothetical protein ACTJKN_07290 [Pedobacter sp. 22163]|uniref:hypothetical protein n=1 Tax=Pedobacter sp. 22163 TaxID=3453883 RepID=UPI003F86B154
MDDELGNIYSLYQSVNPIADLSEEKAKRILEDLEIISARIIDQLHLSEALNGNNPSVIARYQRSLCILDDSIWEEIENASTLKEKHTEFKQQFLKKFSGVLLKLTREIRKFFPENFDERYPAPMLHLQSEARHLDKKLAKLSSQAVSDAENELLSILETTISLSNLRSIKAGFFHLGFLADLLGAMNAAEDSSGNKTQRWKNLMIEYGFNSPAFYSYCCMEIIKKRDNCQDIIESYSELYWIKKRLQQLVPWNGMPFHKALPDIKISLLNFVDAEISHLQSLEKIGGDLAGYGQINENFRVSFSVKELAYFIHLQVECGIILEEKPKKIHQYVIGHYSTRETEKISEKSFKNAYYAKGSDGVKKVIEKLSQMLARAQALS